MVMHGVWKCALPTLSTCVVIFRCLLQASLTVPDWLRLNDACGCLLLWDAAGTGSYTVG